jgi:peptide-methionine (S)-S-oxide reductase
VLRTRVGYCGGTTKNPTYRSIGDHAETIQIDFDPTRIRYEQLLELFWTTHNPCRNAWSRQYMSAVFYANEAQREAIEVTRHKFVKTPEQIQTEIVPLDTFWIAEDYHQKYRLRHEGAIDDELHAIYPNEADYIRSTAAARLNGYLDGHGSEQQLEREIGKLGLSAEGQARLRKAFR